MSELCQLTATDMVRAVRAGEITRTELVEAHLNRIAKVNPIINAIVELREDEAVDDAKRADKASQARPDLPLDGVPIVIKDHFDVSGMKHTEGVRSMADRRSPADAPAVRRLRSAGAIILGKCNQPDFQIRWNTISDLYGTTRNPRDLRLSPGGSSGGDAAAVASGMAAVGLGADYGGSIRVPAGWCGIYGIRPSGGRVPDVPTLPPVDPGPTAEFMSIGPLTRSLEDLRTVLGVISGPDTADPGTVQVPENGKASVSRPRVACMLRQTGAIIDPEVEANVARTAEALAASGYEVVDAGIPHARRAPDVWGQLAGTEILRFAMREWAPQLGDSGRQHIEVLFGLWAPSERIEPFIEAWSERRTILRETALWMEDYPLVLAPVAGMAVPQLDFDEYLSTEEVKDLFDHMRNVVWVNLLGLPSVALPNGLQLVARRFHEEEAITCASVIAETLGAVEIAEVAESAPNIEGS